MPGLMMDFPGPGKLKWAANVATAESEAKYFIFEKAVLQSAFVLKQSFYELRFGGMAVSVIPMFIVPGLFSAIEEWKRAQRLIPQGATV